MAIIHQLQKFFWGFGLDIQKYNKDFNVDHVFSKALRQNGIDLALDVGANIGQFGSKLRQNYEYQGEIISFEPLDQARGQLEKLAAVDPKWSVKPWALGDETESNILNISQNSQSSSILGMEHQHIDSCPDSEYFETQEISVKRLDDIYDDLLAHNRNVLLKLDVQGYEMKALMGAPKALEEIKLVQLEMSIVPLYESELLFEELVAYMRTIGFSLITFEPSFADPVTGALLQVDGLFSRS